MVLNNCVAGTEKMKRIIWSVAVLLGCGGALRANTIPPNWDNLGIKVADSAGLVKGSAPATYTYQNGLVKNVDLGFQFSLYKMTYNTVTVSTRGYIAFTGSQVNSDPVADDNSMAHSNVVRIAPGWWDSEVVNADATDSLAGIYVDTSRAGQTAITFADMTFERLDATQKVPANQLSTFQVILYLDGSIAFRYKTLNAQSFAANGGDNSLDGAAQVVIGVANNNGSNAFDTAPLAQVALGTASASQACNTNGCYDTVYQKIANPLFSSSAPGILLSDVNLVYVPNASGGWTIANNFPQADTLNSPEPGTLLLLAGIAGLLAIFRRKITQTHSGDQKI